jgi:hypothetical protein
MLVHYLSPSGIALDASAHGSDSIFNGRFGRGLILLPYTVLCLTKLADVGGAVLSTRCFTGFKVRK